MSDGEEIGQLSQNCQQVVRMQIEWTIENVFSYSVVDKYGASPRFVFQSSRWCLRIYPYGETAEKSAGWIGLFLWGEDEDMIRANVTFGIKRADGKVVNQRHGDLCDMFRRNVNYSGHPKFIERSELLESRSDLAPLDTLTLTCTLTVDDGPLTHSVQEPLSKNLADLFISKRSCDAILKVQQQEFSVHKCILGARSPVFQAMFDADLNEKDTGVVDIADCHAETFKDFLQYLYSGKFESNSNKVFELYRIADKYCVRDLKATCVISMMFHLSLETFFETAVLANEFCEAKLQQKTQLFFNDNFGKIISATDWESFLKDNNALVSGLLKKMASDKKL